MSAKKKFSTKPDRDAATYILNGTTPQSKTKSKNSLKTPTSEPKRRHSDETPPQCKVLNESSSTPDYFKPIQLGTPKVATQKKNLTNSTSLEDSESVTEEDSSVVVAVRVRPLSQREINDPEIKTVVQMDDCTVTVQTGDGGAAWQRFTYDHCFWSVDKLHLQYADQQKVYEAIAQPLLDKAFEGYNTCLFAYGQTGSGKSYSIMGQQDHDIGIIPRFCEDLFERIKFNEEKGRICVEISFFEIYNEKIHDLLASSEDRNKKKVPMRVREHPVLGPYVVDLSTFVVTCYDDLASWLSLGNKQRATASTGMNEKSSRSHSVFTIVITQTDVEIIDGETHEHSRKSKVNLVDLAGSERIDTSKTVGNRTKEGASINKSLLTLGKVISHLAEMKQNGSRKLFIPYRESVLTWLLKESLGGNSKTTMLATISPANVHVDETLSTLRYAKQAGKIVNVAKVNEDPKAKVIRELRAEIDKLRSQQCLETPTKYSEVQDEINALRERLRDSEQLLEQVTKTWQEKLSQATKCKAEEAENLEKAGIAFQINNQLPNLVNLNEDPQLSETLLYLLRLGETRVGRMQLDSKQDIQLRGSLILDYHCTINNADNIVTIAPNNDGQTYVNGHLIEKATQLSHGDRVVLGGEHYFRFNNPLQVQQSSLRHSTTGKDFLYAKTELLQVQEARMKAVLQKEREEMKQEMLGEIEHIKHGAELEISLQRQGFENRIKELNQFLEVQHKEIEQSETSRYKLEVQNKLLQQEIEFEKQQNDANRKSDELVPMTTNFLHEIEQCFAIQDKSIHEKSFQPQNDVGLYELWVMIKKANNICQQLGKPLIFVQQDRVTENGIEIIVKVQDEAHDLMLEWSTDKFQQKLKTLHQMLDGDNDLELFDSNDNWKKDEHLLISYSSKILESFQKAYQAGNQGNISLSISELSFDDSPNKWSDVRGAARRSIIPKPLSPTADHLELGTYDICKAHCTLMIQSFTDSCSSNFGVDVGGILVVLSKLHTYAKETLNTFLNVAVTTDERSNVSKELTKQVLLLLMQATKVSALFALSIKTVSDLREQFSRAFDKLGSAVVFIIQGMETNSDALLQTSVTKLENAILNCSNITGQVAANYGLSLRDDDTMPLRVNQEIGTSFISGLETTTRRALKAAAARLEDSELQLNLIANDSFFGNVKDTRDIILLCQESAAATQQWLSKYIQLQSSTSKDRIQSYERFLPISTQTQQIIINFANLNEAFSSLCHNVELMVKGELLDVAEMSNNVSDIRGLLETLSSVSHLYLGTSVMQDDISRMTSSKCDQEAELQSLQQCVKKIVTATQDLKKALRLLVRKNYCATVQQQSNWSHDLSQTLKADGTPLKGILRNTGRSTFESTTSSPPVSPVTNGGRHSPMLQNFNITKSSITSLKKFVSKSQSDEFDSFSSPSKTSSLVKCDLSILQSPSSEDYTTLSHSHQTSGHN